MASGNFDPEVGVASDKLTGHAFNGGPVMGTVVFDDAGPEHVPIHFTTAAARDAFASALDTATSTGGRNVVVQNYLDHAVGGYWGTVGVAL